MNSAVPKLAFSIREAAAAGLGSKSTVERLIARGRLRAVKSGHRTLILAADLAAYLAALPAAEVTQ